jgi:hypothetical protein
MKIGFGKLTASVGALVLALGCAPNSWAGCGPDLARPTHASWYVQPGAPSLLEAGLVRVSSQQASIVGLWHFKQASGMNVFDAGYEEFHSDGTEIYNSGSRAPDTGNFCMGVWQQVGPYHYKLNHRAIGWASGGTTPAYIATILEDLTLSHDGNSFSGRYKVTAYDVTGHLLQVISSGTLTGARIGISDTVPGALF